MDAIARMPYSLPCSAFQNLNMDGLLERMWESMALVRVYTKRARALTACAVCPKRDSDCLWAPMQSRV